MLLLTPPGGPASVTETAGRHCYSVVEMDVEASDCGWWVLASSTPDWPVHVTEQSEAGVLATSGSSGKVA